MRGLEADVASVLDRRLRTGTSAPVAVALSGGGDSLALTLIVDAWAKTHGREVVILTVDHGLRPESPDWVAFARRTAARLNRPFHALAWTGAKPTRGLPAAARRVRHALLAEAARAAGARVILMGHTADDVLEAAAMRDLGSTTPDPRVWRPSPAWPQGRGTFLLRPLLGVRRAGLRDWLNARGESWIEDPANTDLRYARARARAASPSSAALKDDQPQPLALMEQASEQWGVVRLPRRAFKSAATGDAERTLALMAVCAGGGDRIPAAPRVARLAAALMSGQSVRATLAGARIEADESSDKAEVLVFREAGEAARGGLGPIQAPGVWDGRFEVTGAGEVRRLQGLAARLPREQQAAVRSLPPAARSSLPALVTLDGQVTCPALAGAQSLVGDRLWAAAGLVQREPD